MTTTQIRPEQTATHDELATPQSTQSGTTRSAASGTRWIAAAIVVLVAASAIVLITRDGASSQDRATSATTARMESLAVVMEAEQAGLSVPQFAQAIRLEGLADANVPSSPLTHGQLADAARWTGLADSPTGLTGFGYQGVASGLTKAEAAAAARWSRLAEVDSR